MGLKMCVLHLVHTQQVPLRGDSPRASRVSACFASRGRVCFLLDSLPQDVCAVDILGRQRRCLPLEQRASCSL